MVHKIVVQVALATTLVVALVVSGNASPLIFSTGATNNLIGAASRPGSGPAFEVETADDFFLTNPTSITSATFTGLITAIPGTTPSVGGVTAEIYRIFPLDSNTVRPINVPTRMNSPSDNALASHSSGSGLSFSTTVLSSTFTALNSVGPFGINPLPSQHTGGNGPVTGQEVQFNLTFSTPFDLADGHYFFVPQVQVTGGDFFWLSAERPITTMNGGTPFPAGTTDLQGWTRDAALDPDWLRVGGDIVGTPATGPTFNFSFSLNGDAVPLPATLPLFATGVAGLGLLGWRRKRKALRGRRFIAAMVKRRNLKRLVVSVSAAIPLMSIAAPSASANVLLSYTGDQFAFAGAPFTMSDSITAAIVLSSPLSGPSSNIVTPLSWSISAGPDTFTSQCSTCTTFFSFDLDRIGLFVAWNVVVTDGTETILTRILGGSPLDEVRNPSPVAGTGVAGTWVQTPISAATPLPAALPLFATGLGALGLLGWRRKRKAQAV